MITENVYKTLTIILRVLRSNKVNWVLIGSLNLFLQGVEIEYHDIDIYTDKEGVSLINKIFGKYVIQPINFSETDVFKSFRGIFKINDCLVDVVSDLHFRPSINSKWFKSSGLSNLKTLKYKDLLLPVTPLNEEYQAYINMGRLEKAKKIKNKINETV
jgi:hypothetical protein